METWDIRKTGNLKGVGREGETGRMKSPEVR
jgi:hypothetical protein